MNLKRIDRTSVGSGRGMVRLGSGFFAPPDFSLVDEDEEVVELEEARGSPGAQQVIRRALRAKRVPSFEE